ncbi:MAG: hypothetical protein HC854_01275 [Flavobacterium sp.]|nr:hypothetical protein [Flavobacterium sp.]
MFLDRGYTGHEHLLGVNIINMNGRIYDDKLHRFFQPDNNIQDPFNSQNLNRYAYVMNNPTKYVDTSGELWEWIVGTIFSSYASGVRSSGGELNPLQWSSESWTNAALSGTSFGVSVAATNYSNNYIENYGSQSSITGVEQPNFSAFNTNNIEAHKYVQVPYNQEAWGYALVGTGALLADNVTGIGFVDDVLIPVVWGGAAAYWTIQNIPAIVGSAVGAYEYIENSVITLKRDLEIKTILDRALDGPPGYQYALIANSSGYYPIMSRGSSTPTGAMYLNAGDVWKYGQTTSGSRYSDAYKAGIGTAGVTEVQQFYGTQKQILIAEKLMIYNYYYQNGHLPPGNKIFR